jgi:hypothetical protein
MYAYHIHDLAPHGGMDALRAHPAGRRLVAVGRWQLAAHPAGGSLATWAGHPFSPSAYGEPVPTHDGMFFMPPKDWGKNPHGALARNPLPESAAVQCVNGDLLVGVATRSARPRRFAGGPSIGRPSGDLADAAFALWDRLANKDTVLVNDPGLSQVIFLGIQACYRVTEEALDALGWVTTADDDELIRGIFGLDPKPEAGAGAMSPSPAPASSAPPA